MTANGSPDPPDFRIEITRAGERTIVAVGGEIDIATAGEFQSAVREQLAQAPVLLDLRALTFMDSSGVAALDALMRDCERERWELAIDADLPDPVRRVLELTGLLSALPLQESTVGEERA